MISALYRRRKTVNAVAIIGATAAAIMGLSWLCLILWSLLSNGLSAIDWALFTQMTPPPGNTGGLLNAMFGSLVMSFVAMVAAIPIGVLAGTYLAEYSGRGRLGPVVRFINDVLLSAPSIIVGLFVYVILVVPVGHFSGWAGSAALAIVALPVIVRTTEDMLRLVPSSIHEAAFALGAPKWKVITSVAYRAARNGMITGALLAVARISGETAPLLFTALNNQFWNADMGAPMANLPVVIFQFALSPYEDWQRLAWGGATVITLTILSINIVARLLTGIKVER
jgi:phosphate transport system permease protein